MPPARKTNVDAAAKPAAGGALRLVLVAVAVAVAAAAVALSRGGPAPAGSTAVPAAEPAGATFVEVPCSESFLKALREDAADGACVPQLCGRAVEPGFLSREEAAGLRGLLEHALSLPGMGGAGPVSVLDMASGALSRGENFVDGFRALKEAGRPLPEDGVALYRRVRDRVRERVWARFFGGAQDAPLEHARPSFFSRIDATPARTPHDEYYHPHVDKLQYGSFAFTALVYLADGGGDEFEGRDFVFDSAPEARLEPRVGTLSYFTSGDENVHHVERVAGGVRFALTIAFSCGGQQR